MLGRTILLGLILAGSLEAQVRVAGRVERATSATCSPAVRHRFECTNLFLVSRDPAIDLNNFVGRVVEVDGNVTGVGCRVIGVRSVMPARCSVTWSGNPTPNGRIRFELRGPGLSRWALWLGAGHVFLPLSVTHGTWLLGPPIFFVASGSSGGMDQLPLHIPNDPGLIGVRTFWQAAHQTVGPIGPFSMSNLVCFAIR